MDEWSDEEKKRYRRMAARHEAAHAVAAVNLGLPLASTSIEEWRAIHDDAGAVVDAEGETRVDPEQERAWMESPEDPESRKMLEAIATMATAGFIANGSFRINHTDMERIRQIVACEDEDLASEDIEELAQEDVGRYLDRVHPELYRGDDERFAAWVGVEELLVLAGRLDGEKVREIVAAHSAGSS